MSEAEELAALKRACQRNQQDIWKLKAALIHALTIMRHQYRWLEETNVAYDPVEIVMSLSWVRAYLFEPQPGDDGYVEPHGEQDGTERAEPPRRKRTVRA